MITEQDLNEAIAECEGQRNPNSNTCLKLAAFYTIKDKMYPDKGDQMAVDEPVFYSRSSAPAVTNYESDTEFGKIVAETPSERVLSVMDELMGTLEMLNPRLYASVLRKLTTE